MRVVGRPCGVKCKRVSQITFAFASALLEAAVRAVWWSRWRSLDWLGLLDLLGLRGLVTHDDDNGAADQVDYKSQQPTRDHQELQ